MAIYGFNVYLDNNFVYGRLIQGRSYIEAYRTLMIELKRKYPDREVRIVLDTEDNREHDLPR